MEEAFNWIRANICLSRTIFHIDGCKILINLFEERYRNEPFFSEASDELIGDLLAKEALLIIEV